MTALLSFNYTSSLLSSNALFPLTTSLMMSYEVHHLKDLQGRSSNHRTYEGHTFLNHNQLDSVDSNHLRKFSRRHQNRKRKRRFPSSNLRSDDSISSSNARPPNEDISSRVGSTWWEKGKKVLDLGDEESKKRRHVNSPYSEKPNEAQLYNVNSRTLLGVHKNGSISTTEGAESSYSIFRVFYLCSIFAFASLQNCSDRLKFSEQLYFVESQRYLCIDSHRNIYTDTMSNNKDCILKHELLTNNYDVYYSDGYPQDLGRCHRGMRRPYNHLRKKTEIKVENPSNSTTRVRHHHRKINTHRWKSQTSFRPRVCSTRWYLGIGTDTHLKIFITGENRTKKEAFFIQKWRHTSDMSQLNRGIVLGDREIMTSRDLSKDPGPSLQTFNSTLEVPYTVGSTEKDLLLHNTDVKNLTSSSKTIPKQSDNTSLSTSNSIFTRSPLKRTRSSFLTSLRHRKDKGIECSNLLKANCDTSGDMSHKGNLSQVIESG